MSERQRSTLLAYLRRLSGRTALDGSDAELLERFAAVRDETAFEALLRRHGPLVWNVCRRALADEHAAEDAFQATFLVLVRKARSVSKQASLRSWLHGVALRVALHARQQQRLRRLREQETPIRHPGDAAAEADWQDVRPILDEEIQRLPEKYRLPIILCYLEGKTNDEAARLLNCPRGTIATHLAQARERLRVRLIRRGLTLSAGTMVTLLTGNAMSAVVPSILLAQTAKLVLSGAVSVSLTTLTEGVLHAMFMSKIKMAFAVILMSAAIGGAGAGVYYLHAQDPAPKSENAVKQPEKAASDKRATEQEKRLQENENPPFTGLIDPFTGLIDPGDKKWQQEQNKRMQEFHKWERELASLQGTERLKALLKQRREQAKTELTIRYELYRVGANEPTTGAPITLTMLHAASKHLLKAEVELSEKKADRLAAHEKNVKLLKEVAKITEAQFRVGKVSTAALAQAQYEQLDAEIALEREKARK